MSHTITNGEGIELGGEKTLRLKVSPGKELGVSGAAGVAPSGLWERGERNLGQRKRHFPSNIIGKEESYCVINLKTMEKSKKKRRGERPVVVFHWAKKTARKKQRGGIKPIVGDGESTRKRGAGKNLTEETGEGRTSLGRL